MNASLLRRTLRTALVCTLAFTLATPPSFAWGHQGHRLTALVAQQYLTPAAQAAIKDLLHGQTIADVASWADDFRTDHPETAKWHFVDIPGSASTFDRDRDCPLTASDPKSPWRDCITDRILYFEGRLGDTSLSLDERATALKFVVHLIGDIHQPFHAMGDNRGGNTTKVTFLGSTTCGTSRCNLHAVWDDALLEDESLTDKKFVAKMQSDIRENHWEALAGGQPTAWANASHRYAVLAQAPDGALLMSDYVKDETRVVNSEIALGGLRLAHVLNRILDPQNAAAKP